MESKYVVLMTLGVGCKDNKSSYVMVVEDNVDREVINPENISL